MKPTFFATPLEMRAWLRKHHATSQELLVGYYKRGTGKPSITWPESVAEALCFGWIDGVRKSVDDGSYTIRFTPRKPGSIWSAVNIGHAQRLIESGLMQPAGLAAFQKRKEARSAIYAYEQKGQKLGGKYAQKLRANRKAWDFFQAQPPTYRRTTSWWVISAKKEETRLRRLERLIADSAQGRRIAPLTRKQKPM